jgi:hypothetical protein
MTDVNGSPEVAELQDDIARTREDLARTVDQLAAKLDVKSRVRERAVEVKDAADSHVRSVRDRATGPDGRPTPTTWAVGGGVVAAAAAVVLVSLWLRPRHRRRGR